MMDKEKLIYDLVFSNESEFKIDIGRYIEDIYKYDSFIDEIRSILFKSKVIIVSNSIDVDSKTVIWKLKVKR